MLKSGDIPYWRLSAFYFFYFAFLGAWVPFWHLYLEEVFQFNAPQIGSIAAIVLATKIIAPYLWGWLADHFQRRLMVIRWGALFSFLAFLGVFAVREFFWLALIVLLYSFFWNAVLSQFEVVTLSYLGEKSQRYSQVRLWGSIGFIVSVFVLGGLFDYLPIDYLPYFLSIILLAVYLSTVFIEDRSSNVQTLGVGFAVGKPVSDLSFRCFLNIIGRRDVLIFFFVCFLVQLSHGPFYIFYTIYLEQLGYKRVAIGGLWSLGVVAEILLFVVMHKILAKISVKRLMVVALLLSTLRWLLMSFFADSLMVLIFAQLLHAASFGCFHAIAIDVVNRVFVGPMKGRGQAINSAITIGLGGALGAYLSGHYWQYYQEGIFIGAALVTFLGFLLVVGFSLDIEKHTH